MVNEFLYLITILPELNREWLNIVGENIMPIMIIMCLIMFIQLEVLQAYGRSLRATLFRSYRTNIATFVFNSTVLSILPVSLLLTLAERSHQNGLLNVYSQPVQILISFFLLDFILYLWHKANHDFDSLWMFHKVHHCDKSMNVTTAFRVHFIEVLLATVIKALYIIVTGVEITIVALIEAVSVLFVMFHHLNISFRSERWLKWLFIVPSLHRVHHSSLRHQHDSNYGAVFSVWDRMFQTLTELKPKLIGLKNVDALNFCELLLFGLWPGVYKSTQPQSLEKINAMIAEAAYYKAQQRGFAPGFEIVDWLDAEHKINQLNCTA